MIEIIVGLGIMKIIDWLFPDMKNENDPTLFLIDMDFNDNDSQDPPEQWEDWGDM